MSSISKVYTDEERDVCYTCNTNSSNTIDVRGRQTKVDCRNYTKRGVIFESRMVAMGNELFNMGLIDVIDNGVDTSEFSFAPKWGFKVQSRGGGGLSKYDCGMDFQQLEYNPYTKNGYTEMLYVHNKQCQNSFISTEFQDLIFTNDAHSDGQNTDNAFTDAIIMTARQTLERGVTYNDIIGVFAGANEDANSYDGVLAQAYWAYTQNAYFHSEKFIVDETAFVTGTYIHAKYAGKTIDILFDDSQASDPLENRYATRAEAYGAIVDWLNEKVLTENGRRYVDATYVGNEIIVTSRFSEKEVNLLMFVDANATVKNWKDCDKTGVSIELLQNSMSVDERPFLVKYRKYTMDTILIDLPKDIHDATIDMSDEHMVVGQEKALFIDKVVWENYTFALQYKASTATMGSLRETFGDRIYAIKALHNTGLWFVTMVSANRAARNIVHLVDAQGSLGSMISVILTPNCKEVELAYEQLHGVMVRDFRLFASNLLCSPFVDNLVEPYEKTLQVLPCYDKRVRERFIDPVNQAQGCVLDARFEVSDEYQNGALYALPDGSGGYDIHVLEAGETAPVGALPVYEIQITDKSTGIPTGETATYSYVVTFDDGTELTSTAQNPLLQFVNESAGITFNVQQTVTTTNCTDSYIASQEFGEDFPFEVQGACADVSVVINGTIFRSPVYTLTQASGWQSDITVYVNGVLDTINMSGVTNTSASEAAIAIQAYLDANNYTGTATSDGNTVTVTSAQVIFNLSGATEFSNEKFVSMQDDTAWDSADGIGTISIDVAGENFTSLPVSSETTGISDDQSFAISGTLVSKLGCTFDLPEVTVLGFVDGQAGLYYQNFQLIN